MNNILLVPIAISVILTLFIPLVEVAQDASEKTLRYSEDMSRAIDCAFAGVNIGSFTPILNNGSSFVTFRLKSIGESIIKPFTQVESSVTTAWKNQQQAKAIQAYFERMKSSASIEIIRK